MSDLELTEAFLARAAGWEAVKSARRFLAADQVLSSNWTPPVLKGIVQEGATAYRAGLVIKGPLDIENLCTCRASRQWGILCAHSVAVGLHVVRGPAPADAPPATADVAAGIGTNPAATVVPAGRRLSTSTLGGEPAQLHVILPPNMASAVAHGRVMVCFEGQGRGRRMPLSALPKSADYQWDAADARVLDWIEERAGGVAPALLQLSLAELDEFWDRLAEHPRVTLGKSQNLAVTRTPWRAPVTARLETSGEIQLTLTPSGPIPMRLSPVAPGPEQPAATSATRGSVWGLTGSVVQPIGLPRDCAALLEGPMRIERSQVPGFLNRDWPALLAAAEVHADFQLDDFSLEPKPPRFHLELTGGLARLEARLGCAYGPRFLTLGVGDPSESFWLPDPDHPTRYATRNPAAEQAARERLRQAGFTGPDALGKLQLVGETAVVDFFARVFPRLEKEWKVTLDTRLEQRAADRWERIEPRFTVTASGEQWFDLDIAFGTASGESLGAVDIQQLLESGRSHARLKNGRWGLLDTAALAEFEETLRDCAPQQRAGHYRLEQNQAAFLEQTLDQQPGWSLQAPPAWRTRADRQTGVLSLDPPPLGPLETVLRPYQKSGVAWLLFLRDQGLGGVLADEMGLGKTLQLLALIQIVRDRAESVERRPFLVVCPTSLVFHWADQAAQFTPRLRVLAIEGPDRQAAFDQAADHDLVITSYALVRRDAPQYRGRIFDTVVLDEAQHIKNRQTQNAQAVKAIRAAHRLVLTGTPLENSVLDLWSIFDFLMPGYLGAAADFHERYELPITRDRDPRVQARLVRRIRPFLRRRVKREVAPELPARLQETLFCELTPEQKSVYQQLLEAGRREVVAAVGARGLDKSRMMVLTVLLRLRQVCCDLRLLSLPEPPSAGASAKLELFGELLDEALDGSHRVLVFSQFTRLLGLLREKLTADGLEYCYLDGATSDRAGQVQRFQTRPDIPVFLISLKAGGVGLNLSAADTVIHYDPWWNPATEDQATDRAHRIGQTRVVTSYKLIARGTVEEKILHLQERKRALLQGVLGDEDAWAGSLTWEEIQSLLD